MSGIDSIARLLRPRSVAVIGASADAAKTAGRPVAYLRKHGVPKAPEDLAEFDAIAFAPERSTPSWLFEGKRGKISVRPRAQLVANASEVGIQAALAGRGLTRVLSYMVASDLRAGRLRLVLEDYEPEPLPIHIVYREGRRAPARVRAFADYAAQRLRADLAFKPRPKRTTPS